MTQPRVSKEKTQLLRGTISNYRKTRCSHDFVFTQSDREKMGVTAIAAGLVGLGGIAVGLAGSAMDTTEEADLLEFDLDTKHVRAWVWLSIFKDGDEVEVVAEPIGDAWHGYGIRRIADKTVALYPHCSRGRLAHYRVSFFAWLKWGGGLVGVPVIAAYIYMAATFSAGDAVAMIYIMPLAAFSALLVYGVIAARIAGKFLGFVRLAEGTFTAFGWKDVKHIDLPAITKKTKQPGDASALGVLYFRY